MLKLKIETINSYDFSMALQKAAASSHIAGGVKVRYNLGCLVKELQREAREAGEAYTEMAKPFCELDDKGNIKRPEKIGPGVPPFKFKEPTDPEEKKKFEEEWKKKNEDFMAIEVSLPKCSPVKLEDLEGAELSGADLEALTPIFADDKQLQLL